MNENLQPARAILRRKMRAADPVADALVQAIADHDPAHCEVTVLKTVERLLRTPRFDAALAAAICAGHPEIEAPFGRFLEATNALPHPHSDRDIEEGNRLFEDNAVFGFVGLGCRSLLECYCWNVEAEVLGMTHGMGKNVDRRIPETAMFVLDVMSDRALLEPGHTDVGAPPAPGEDRTPKGVRAVQKIRLLHALIRWLIKHDPEGAGTVFQGPLADSPFVNMLNARWPVAEKGEPISQAFLAGTLLTFSLTVIESMQRLWVPISAEESRAYLQRWKVIGFKLGVDDDLLDYFDTEAGARRLHQAMMAEFRGPTPQGRLMAEALEQFMVRNIVDHLPLHRLFQLNRVPCVVMWHLCSKQTCRAVGMEPGLFGKTLGWLGWQGLRLIGAMKRLRFTRRLSNHIFARLCRAMWGWRREDEPLPESVGLPPVADESKAARAEPRRGVVIDAKVAERLGVPRRAS